MQVEVKVQEEEEVRWTCVGCLARQVTPALWAAVDEGERLFARRSHVFSWGPGS